MSAETSKAVVRQVFEAVWASNDLSPMEAHPGLHEVIPFMRHLMSAMTEPKIAIEQQLCEGDWVATRLTLEANHSGELMGRPATGERVKNEVIMFHRVVNGIIVEQHSQGGRIERR